MMTNIYITPKNDLTFSLSKKFKNFRGFIDKNKIHDDVVNIQDISSENSQVIIYSPNYFKDIYRNLIKVNCNLNIAFYLPMLNLSTKSMQIAAYVYKIWIFLNKANICKKPKLSRYEEHKVRFNIGKHSYAGRDIVISHKKTKIGNYTSIANGVYLGTSQHPTDFLTTHPMTYTSSAEYLYGDLNVEPSHVFDISHINYPVEVGNDCWIGTRAIIMDGVRIGHGAIIASGAVVTRDVPPYAIVGGVPAKIIKYRFDKVTIEKLLEIKWWDFPEEIITKLPFDDVNKCIEILESHRARI